jgi:hypothetical protein
MKTGPLKRVGSTDTGRKIRLALVDAMTDQIFGLSGIERDEPYKAGSPENLVLSEVIGLLKQADRLLDEAGFGG